MDERIGECRVTMVASDGILTSKSVPRSIRATPTNLVLAFHRTIHRGPPSVGSTKTRESLSGNRQVGDHHELESSSPVDKDIIQPGWAPDRYVGLLSLALWFIFPLDSYFNSFVHDATATGRNNRPNCPSTEANAV